MSYFEKNGGNSLLSACASGGCGAKIESAALASLLCALPSGGGENLLVGFEGCDDAAVYKIDGERSLIFTVDFFPPMVDDPKTFGRIAAANALSDVWAMGGEPFLALNLVCFPQNMDKKILAEILYGGAEKIDEAGAALGGGHSIYGKEPKYGLAVTGMAQTARIRRNNTPRPGDKLILTKPLGAGVVMAAARVGEASDAAVKQAVTSMERLNRYAFEASKDFDISACTDVTGFGLLVHALEMASGLKTAPQTGRKPAQNSDGCKVSIALNPQAAPFIPQAADYASAFLLTAAGQRNRKRMEGIINLTEVPFALQELMFDPQTSGGLLMAVSAKEAEPLLEAVKKAGDEGAAIIGEVIPRAKEPVVFRG
ncbi:MAG: selenide, water dikinase SelD [Spirochaetaceae bacterium]|jgi:selenide,water dikinase|nr:selenide, water dikinase SelD [Spirochaetaceae bacterium]